MRIIFPTNDRTRLRFAAKNGSCNDPSPLVNDPLSLPCGGYSTPSRSSVEVIRPPLASPVEVIRPPLYLPCRWRVVTFERRNKPVPLLQEGIGEVKLRGAEFLLILICE